ncbi:MAG: class III signal peptide-containing protein [Methanobrevibacter sp.]|nr:class III signal peptide-containing protein [Methanobrevibacter sp.]
MDESGQSSAELILIIGGLLIIILVVGNYISHISQTTQDSMNKTLTKERDYVINKI